MSVDPKSVKLISSVFICMSINILCWEIFEMSTQEIAFTVGITSVCALGITEIAFKRISLVTQLLIGVSCCATVLTIIYFIHRKASDHKEFPERKLATEIEAKQLLGEWESAAIDSTDYSLRFEFFQGDSVLVTIDQFRHRLTFGVFNGDQLIVEKEGSDVSFNWNINKVSTDSLIVEDYGEVIRFAKIH